MDSDFFAQRRKAREAAQAAADAGGDTFDQRTMYEQQMRATRREAAHNERFGQLPSAPRYTTDASPANSPDTTQARDAPSTAPHDPPLTRTGHVHEYKAPNKSDRPAHPEQSPAHAPASTQDSSKTDAQQTHANSSLVHDARWSVSRSTYSYHKCRCDGCTKANRDYMRTRNATKR